ncbi:MAG: gamma carbonic anhydrase family protein [Gammaproteobacteria bacterium]|jgi:carbonic anhydrase/acetyltransferase-like protein (isoleucine patch superfamily)|nr:gamma carbonic anhydrase family protein [Gammaproteobacteria bacterium]
MTVRKFEYYSPDIAESAYVDESAVVTGNVTLGADSSIWPMASLRGDINSIRVGARSNIQDGSVLHVTHDSEYAPGGLPLVVGNDVTVGHNVVLHACTIEDECLIGMGAIVLDGAVVQRGAMVGAGSLVPPGKVLEGGYLWLGSPVKRVRELSEKEQAYFKYSAQHYVKLKERHRP